MRGSPGFKWTLDQGGANSVTDLGSVFLFT